MLETFSWQPNKEPLKVSLVHFLLVMATVGTLADGEAILVVAILILVEAMVEEDEEVVGMIPTTETMQVADMPTTYLPPYSTHLLLNNEPNSTNPMNPTLPITR